jgi:hypothetical protein
MKPEKQNLMNAAHKLLNAILVKKFPKIIREIEIFEVKEYPQDITFRMNIYITEEALKEAYDMYMSNRDYDDDDELYDNINSYGDSEAELETDIADIIGVDIYNEIQSILMYISPSKSPTPSYSLIAPWMDEEDGM